MKVLILDTGLALELIRRLAIEGHDVKIWIPEQNMTLSSGLKNYGSGIFEHLNVERIQSPEEYLDWPDLVVSSDIVFGGEVKLFKENNIPVIGGTNEACELETDRNKGLELFNKIGMPVPEVVSFSKDEIEEAIEFISDKEEPLVLRFGGISLDTIPRTNVCERPEQAIDILYQVSQQPIDEILIQEYKQGYEIAVGGYFDGNKFQLLNVNWEYKRMFPGDLGPLTGDMGSVITFDTEYLQKSSKLINYLLACGEILKELDYKGYFDISSIYSDNEFYGLEFTVRPGYPTDEVLQSFVSNWGEFLYSIATSENVEVAPKYLWGIGICYCVPKYGFGDLVSKQSIVSGLTIQDITKDNYFENEYFAIEELMYDQELDCLRTVPGLTGRIITAVANDNDFDSALSKAYNLINSISIMDGFYRVDIGSRVKEYIRS